MENAINPNEDTFNSQSASVSETSMADNDLNNLSMRRELYSKFYSSEDYRKFQSDSTSILSDSSDNSESLTDSETRSLRNFHNKTKKKVRIKL